MDLKTLFLLSGTFCGTFPVKERERCPIKACQNEQPLLNLSISLKQKLILFFPFLNLENNSLIVVVWVFSRTQRHYTEFIGQLSKMWHGANFSSKNYFNINDILLSWKMSRGIRLICVSIWYPKSYSINRWLMLAVLSSH